jgi:protein PhnA
MINQKVRGTFWTLGGKMKDCPKCDSPYGYQDGMLWVCPECAHEWSEIETISDDVNDLPVSSEIRDAFGSILVDGDTVTVIKDLKLKGPQGGVKVGSKAKNIKLLSEPVNGHNISCKIDGIGSLYLKSEVVKKS